MKRILGAALLLAACGLAAVQANGVDDTAPAKKPDAAKKDDADPKNAKDAKPAKEEPSKKDKDEPTFNSPPKGATVVVKGIFRGQVTKGSDGKVFSMQIDVGGGKKKEIEVNLAAITRVRKANNSEFDDKGNPKKSAGDVKAAPEDIRGGLNVIVTMSGTKDGAWLVAKQVVITGE